MGVTTCEGEEGRDDDPGFTQIFDLQTTHIDPTTLVHGNVGARGLVNGPVTLGGRTGHLAGQRERVVLNELAYRIQVTELSSHLRRLDDLDGRFPGAVLGAHVGVHTLDGTAEREGAVFLVHVVRAYRERDKSGGYGER